MGNQESRTEGLILDKKSIETPEGWTMLKARMQHSNPQLLSLFSSSPQSKGPEVLELAGKNLMLHRHPNIVKYVTSWLNQDQYCVLTERVWPLSLALEKQTPTQICAGLHSILKALVFLHEKAESSHNNVCCATIYVTTDGSWKLSGFEHLLRFVDCTPESLSKQRTTRNEKIILPEEKSSKEIVPFAIDAYAFGVLAEQVLDGLSDDDQCGLREFRDLTTELQQEDPTCRPALSSLLNLTFFQNPFVLIHDFLTELPMKSESEKDTFFKDLLDTLRNYPQVLVAKHLAELLLSRMVVLDPRAEKYLLPALLRTTGAPSDAADEVEQLFSREVFQKYLVPRLLKMFQVHDTQIRLVLLNHFKNYCFVFSKEQLVRLVLPEVMLGLKDKNDVVVAATLNALASLVPILGGGVVLGGKQCKIFSDCLPSDVRMSPLSTSSGYAEEQKLKKHMSGSAELDSLPERPSPDGGEDVSSTGPTDEETDLWSDWDADQHFSPHRTDSPAVANELSSSRYPTSTNIHSQDDDENEVVVEKSARTSWTGEIEEDHVSCLSRPPEPTRKAMPTKPLVSAVRNVQKPPLPDITSLDIKSSVSLAKSDSVDEFDFFRDMEPVIAKTESVLPLPTEQQSCNKTVGRFDMDLSVKLETNDLSNDASGWGDGSDGWSDIE